MNKQIITGNLTRDPEGGTTAAGVNYARFTVAVRKRYHKEGEPDSDFIQVTAWRGLGDTCMKYLQKGRKVAVIGEPQPHAWIDKDGEARGAIQITADEVEFLGQRGGGNEPSGAEGEAGDMNR